MTERGVVIVGCGNVADRYAEDLARQSHVRLVGAVDIDADRAAAFASRHGIRAFPSLDGALAEPEVEIVANLTGHRAHVPVTRAALDADRHAFSEKPLALSAAEARELVTQAEERGLFLAAAPIVLLGELARTARRWVVEGRLGTVRLAYAEVNWGRIEAWHDDPQAFYDVGPLWDVGVYPVTLLCGLLGRIRRVEAAFATRLLAERRTKAGARWAIGAPDFVTAALTTDGGATIRLTANFYVADPARQRGVELHGDAGSLWISNWFQFGGMLEHAPQGEPYRQVPLLREPAVAMPWAAGVDDLAAAIDEQRQPRADARTAAHVVEVLESILVSAVEGRAVDVASAPAVPR